MRESVESKGFIALILEMMFENTPPIIGFTIAPTMGNLIGPLKNMGKPLII
jgi:hypothetical protein